MHPFTRSLARRGCVDSVAALPCVLLGALAFSLQAHGAGGHHAVDDAALVEPGQCQVEVWTDRERHRARTLSHVGPACRVGPVEIGLNLDRSRSTGAQSFTLVGSQIKWVLPLTGSLSAGAVLAASWQESPSRFVASTVVFPFTWTASETWAMHINAGRDFRRGAEMDTSRAGIAAEWSPHPHWSGVVERFRENRANHWRVGVRYAWNQNVSVDLSRAQGSHGSVPAWWTLGLNWAFDR